MTTLLLLFFALTIELDTVNIPLDSDVKITFAPAGKAEMKREGTVTHVKVEVDQLRPPIAPLNTYVVWAVSPEGIFENLGELQVDRNKGAFQGTTRLNQLGLLITAEPHYMVDRPSPAAAYRSQNTSGETRRTKILVEVGQYDYADLKAPPPGPHPAVVQARAAFQIAQNAGAERIAESEFRQARVALGSMEELITRAAPLDILWPAANDAIRSAQRAVTAARERAILADLQNTKAEVETLTAEKQRLDARIRELTQELTQEQTAAAEQIRILRANIGTASSEKDEAEARAQSAERELAQLKQKQEELQGHLNLELRNDFYDDTGLTEAGRDALIRIHNIAEVIPGPIRLEGNAPENAMKAAMEFLILAGTLQDRIMTRR
jgi:hypothetical protein